MENAGILDVFPIFHTAARGQKICCSAAVDLFRVSLSLDKKLRAKLADTIMILQDNGYELREPYSKHISEGIFELRAKQGSDITRVMYFFYVDRHIILTNGFIKKTQKTPQSEIEKAKRYRSDYLKRKERTL